MKLSVLMGLAHNLADSVASGLGFMIGLYEMDIFGEAEASPEGFMEVDFLNGKIAGGKPSPGLARAIKLYSEEALPRLCESHGATISDFQELKVRFWRPLLAGRFEVAVEDRQSRRATAEYEGSPAKRVKVLDPLGRIRPK
jgi:hypothetical protein